MRAQFLRRDYKENLSLIPLLTPGLNAKCIFQGLGFSFSFEATRLLFALYGRERTQIFFPFIERGFFLGVPILSPSFFDILL